MALAFLSLFLRCNYTVLGWVIGLLDFEKDNVHHAAKSNHVKPIVYVSLGKMSVLQAHCGVAERQFALAAKV